MRKNMIFGQISESKFKIWNFKKKSLRSWSKCYSKFFVFFCNIFWYILIISNKIFIFFSYIYIYEFCGQGIMQFYRNWNFIFLRFSTLQKTCFLISTLNIYTTRVVFFFFFSKIHYVQRMIWLGRKCSIFLLFKHSILV